MYIVFISMTYQFPNHLMWFKTISTFQAVFLLFMLNNSLDTSNFSACNAFISYKFSIF